MRKNHPQKLKNQRKHPYPQKQIITTPKRLQRFQACKEFQVTVRDRKNKAVEHINKKQTNADKVKKILEERDGNERRVKDHEPSGNEVKLKNIAFRINIRRHEERRVIHVQVNCRPQVRLGGHS